MAFIPNEEQLQLRKMVEELGRRELEPQSRRLEEEGRFPRENLKRMAEQDLLGLLTPPPLGGVGADIFSFLTVMETLSGACAATAFIYNTHLAVSLALLAMGSDQQKQEYLPALARGELIAAMAGNEPGGGTNPMAMVTFAEETEDGFALNGNKIFISGAGEAEIYLIAAKTSREPGPRCLSAFLVPKGTPGFTFGKLEDKLGLRAVPTGELIFENCRLPKWSLLGPLGGGMAVVGAAAGLAMLGAGAIALGLAQASLDRLKAHLGDRKILGTSLGEMPAIQAKLADALLSVDAARSYLYKSAHDRLVSPPGMVPSALGAKILATETALRVIDCAIQLHGAYGYSREYPLEKYYRDARALTIHFGTNDVLRGTMAKLALGLM